MTRRFAIACALILNAGAIAQPLNNATATPPAGFAPATATRVLSGDSWIMNGRIYRLFGAQSCIGRTIAVSVRNERFDCGELSRAALSAYFEAHAVECRAIDSPSQIDYQTCILTIQHQRFDLAAAMIATGYAFAALQPDPRDPRRFDAIVKSYAVLETEARKSHAGLWSYTFTHPFKLQSDAYFRKSR